MKIYKITIKQKSGLLSKLQSDTIFGHFCWRLFEEKGEEFLAQFIARFKNNEPDFTVSNAFLEINNVIKLDKPLIQNKFDINSNLKEKKIINFLEHKKSKSNKFISVKNLNKFISGDHKVLDAEDEELEALQDISITKGQLEKELDLRVGITIDRNSQTTLNGMLYSVAPEYTRDNVTYVIFIKILKDQLDYNVLDIFKNVFEIGFGKKKSSGYGEFEWLEPVEYTSFDEPKDSNGFVTFSNYIPSKDDMITNCYYDYIVKYGKLGEEFATSSNPFKKPIILLTPGSCFYTDVKKDFYGSCVDKVANYNNDIVQNGIAFTLKAKI